MSEASEGNHFSAMERINALESLTFITNLLLAAQPQLAVLLSAHLAMDSPVSASATRDHMKPSEALTDAEIMGHIRSMSAHCERFIGDASVAINRTHIFMSTNLARSLIQAPKVVRAPAALVCRGGAPLGCGHEVCNALWVCVALVLLQLRKDIVEVNWEKMNSQSDDCAYVVHVTELAESLWGYLCDGDRDVSSDWFTPFNMRQRVWALAVQSIMECLVEGYSGIRKCSIEGRSRMSSDLQQIQMSIDKGDLKRGCVVWFVTCSGSVVCTCV